MKTSNSGVGQKRTNSRHLSLDGVGKSQQEIATLLGCTPQYVSKVEARALLKMRNAAKAMGISIEDLLNEPRIQQGALLYKTDKQNNGAI